MEEDLIGAERRDKRMRSLASRRKAFARRKKWYVNKNGNWQIEDNGFRVTIFKKGGYWKGVVSKIGMDKQGTFTRERFSELDKAKMAAFDTLVFLQDSEPPKRPTNPSDYF